MSLKDYYFLIILIFPCLLIGQGETSNWYFGQGAGIEFQNDGSVIATTDGQLSTFEGCATISDSLGNLLFYTDGITVYNRNHTIMQNGNGLFGDPSSTQSAIIIPQPGDENKLFIFTVDTSSFQGDPDFGLRYSIVDMTENDGNGAVMQKNIKLLDFCSEKITAVVKDCFEQSIWVMTLSTENANPQEVLNTYYAYEVNTDGIQTNPVKSTFELITEDPRGYLKFNADGTRLASANFTDGLYIYDFDNETGIVSNQQKLAILSGNSFPYGLEFSPNQQYLYAQASNNAPPTELGVHSSSLIQFDLNENDIVGSQVVIDVRPIYRGALQLGANNKIYRALTENFTTGTSFLGVIENPDEKGAAANYNHNAISLNGKIGTQGLPPFIQSFFDKTSLIQNADGTTSNTLSVCEKEQFVLEAENITQAIYNWQKDGVAIENSGPILTIDNATIDDAGLYTLEIILSDPSACPIIGEAFITVNSLPETPTIDLTQCDLDEDNSSDGITLFNLEQIISDEDDYFFFESTDDINSNNFIQQPIGYINTTPFNTTIFYKKVNELGCENIGELNLSVIPTLTDNSSQRTLNTCDENPEDTILEGSFDLFEALDSNTITNFETTFYLNRQDVALEINPLPSNYFSETSVVYARVENENQCVNIIEINLLVNPTPVIEFPDKILFCTDGPPIIVSAADGYDSYRWTKNNDSGIISSSTNQLTISEIGFYSLEVGFTYTFENQIFECTSTKIFEVVPSNIATIENVIIQDISDENSVEILVSGDGDYEFSIDGLTYQDSNTFNNVAAGIFSIFVRDKNNCGIAEKLISVIGYPKFFTPNGDNINDTWQIIGLNNDFQPNSTISIFNRFGKLMTQISANSIGWNGTVNNNQLPESDYWFSVMLDDGRVFKGHFTLKR